MPYDEQLAERVRLSLKGKRNISEKKMFGGLSFLVRGNMFCGIVDRDLMVRVGTDAYQRTLARPHAREMDFTGRPLKGMVYVGAPGVRTSKQLQSWLDLALTFAKSLPAK